MNESFASSSVVVTGASRGIGRMIAETFARKTEHALILIARTSADLEVTQDRCEAAGATQICSIPCDLTNAETVNQLKMSPELPTPGIIINNAGTYLLKSLQRTHRREFADQIQSNLFTAVHVIDRFLDELKELDRSLIINICSSGALDGLPDSGAYASSKHALLGYTRSLRQELLKTEIGVTALNLGQTQSTSWEGSSVDPQSLIDPQDVADLLVALTKLSPRSVAEEIILKPQHGRVPPM